LGWGDWIWVHVVTHAADWSHFNEVCYLGLVCNISHMQSLSRLWMGREYRELSLPVREWVRSQIGRNICARPLIYYKCKVLFAASSHTGHQT
jgi:hypothetical protein